MYTTVDETGRLNNYATEPPVYLASFPSIEKQRAYLRQALMATALIATLMVVAVTVS